MIKLLHTGDIHIGYRQYNIKERLADFRRAFERVAETAVSESVDAVILAGDIFEHSNPTSSDLHFVRDIVRNLRKSNIEAFGIEGTHDHANGHILAVCEISDLLKPINFKGIIENMGFEFNFIKKENNKNFVEQDKYLEIFSGEENIGWLGQMKDKVKKRKACLFEINFEISPIYSTGASNLKICNGSNNKGLA